MEVGALFCPQGASLGLASGLAGGAAAITKKVLNSQQMKKVEVAIEVKGERVWQNLMLTLFARSTQPQPWS